ncbi:fibronectin type III domain-containing protein [Winogradskyella sp.]
MDISNDQVEITAPSNNSTLTITNVNFSWESIHDAEQYKLQIATPSFEEANQVVLDTTIIATGFIQGLSTGDYQWRVRAENSDYQTVFTTQSFSIEE